MNKPLSFIAKFSGLALALAIIILIAVSCDKNTVTNENDNNNQNNNINNTIIKEQGVEVEFETIDKGFNGGIKIKQNYTINDEKDWQEFWQELQSNLTSPPEAPTIDFDEKIILAVTLGEKSTGGYDIEITKIVENENEIQATVKEVSPEPSNITTQAFVRPYHIIEIDKTIKDITFN